MLFRCILAACLVAGIAPAQGKRGGSGGNKSEDNMGVMTRMPRMTRFDTIADKLRLSREQKEQAAAFFDAAQEAAAPLNEQIGNGRNQIAGAMIQGQNNGEGFTRLTDAYTALLAQMAAIEATAYGKLYAILKPNQQSKAPLVFAEQFPGLFASRDYKRVR